MKHKMITRELMKEMEEYLPLVFEKNDMDGGAEEQQVHQPFALVTSVGTGTPAHRAGICAGDKVYRFGKLRDVSFVSDNELFAAVKEQQTVSDRVLLSVIRGDKTFSASLECRSGPLGMHLKTTTIQ